MKRVVVVLAGVALGILMVVVNLSTSRLSLAPLPSKIVPLVAAHANPQQIEHRPLAPHSPDAMTIDDDEAAQGGQIDMQGDEVKPALATYGVDRTGNLYEIHSPMTEVPRLASPVS